MCPHVGILCSQVMNGHRLVVLRTENSHSVTSSPFFFLHLSIHPLIKADLCKTICLPGAGCCSVFTNVAHMQIHPDADKKERV